MLDFASALYLGMRHPSGALGRWDALTLGRPAAATEPPGAAALAAALARLAGFEAATLAPSTLHLFWDLLGMLASERIALLVDDASYPIARWGAQHAAAAGVPLQLFAHGAPHAAHQLARGALQAGRRPVIVADGYFPGRDLAPPLGAYADIARAGNGYLVLDDTQAFGLVGRDPAPPAPYGTGGGGSAQWHGIAREHVLVAASLAKGFGAPLAVLCASGALVRRFERCSQVRTHCSPPSVAAIRAGLHALQLNREQGDALRARLWCRVAHWRAALARHGIAAHGGTFPVQTLELPAWVDGLRLHQDLRAAGIDTVPQRVRAATVSFLITASHTGADIERAVAVLARCLGAQRAADHATLEAI